MSSVPSASTQDVPSPSATLVGLTAQEAQSHLSRFGPQRSRFDPPRYRHGASVFALHQTVRIGSAAGAILCISRYLNCDLPRAGRMGQAGDAPGVNVQDEYFKTKTSEMDADPEPSKRGRER
jgi:hypothetical protein